MASTSEADIPTPFSAMPLDDRILQGIAGLGWTTPTLIQEKAIPLALEGKDILAKARTGSGKTAIFTIPILQGILDRKMKEGNQSVRALILTPTKELSEQMFRHISELKKFCSRDIMHVDVSKDSNIGSSRGYLLSNPDIVIGTPMKVLTQIQSGNLPTLKESLEYLVIDEADLILSLGFDVEMKEILGFLSKTYQAFLTSATLSDDVKALKKLTLHNPVTLKLSDSELPTGAQLTQYYINCSDEDKFLIIYAMIKLKLIKGKSIIFVNKVDRSYRGFKKDIESGVSRGIDFFNVSNVINFDFPPTVDAYIHRIGRTARGWNRGTALSLAGSPPELKVQKKVKKMLDTHGECSLKPYELDLDQLDGFRYRAMDAFKAVTTSAVREARLEEIKNEILASSKLKRFFEENPRDLSVLRHDKASHAIKSQPHLRHVPDYLETPEGSSSKF